MSLFFSMHYKWKNGVKSSTPTSKYWKKGNYKNLLRLGILLHLLPLVIKSLVINR